jgi:hypothetical protein
MGLFHLQDRTRARVTSVSNDGVDAIHHGYGEPHRRSLKVTDHGLQVSDSCAAYGRKRLHFHLGPAIECHSTGGHVELSGPGVDVCLHAEGGTWRIEQAHRSDGYGRVAENMCLVLDLAGDIATWRLNWR